MITCYSAEQELDALFDRLDLAKDGVIHRHEIEQVHAVRVYNIPARNRAGPYKAPFPGRFVFIYLSPSYLSPRGLIRLYP